MRKYFPFLIWVPKYNGTLLRNDIMAGLTVGTMLIPQGMAYALLAGLPPIAGLYAALVPLLIYPIFGTSRQLSIGPVAMDSLLVAAGVGAMAVSGTSEYIALSILLALVVGGLQFLMGITKLGFLVNFLSQPLINGFTSAAAIIIGLSQVKHLFRIEFEGSQQAFLVIWRIITNIQNIHLPTFIIGVACIVFLLLLKKWKPNWPGALITVAVSTVVVWVFKLDQQGVKIVGEVPKGLPSLHIPVLDLATIQELIPIALAISLISFMEAIAVAKKYSAKEGYMVDANQELVALGMSNMSAGIFGGYPIAGSFSRTAVNAHAGAKTPMSSVFNALTIALTLLFLTPLFFYMPKAVLAAIVIVAILGLIDVKEPKRLYHIRKQDFLILVFAFIVTLSLGAPQGILLSAIASIILIIRRISHPNVAILGRTSSAGVFRNVKRDPRAMQMESLIIFRIDASLYYANAGYLKDKVMEQLIERKSEMNAFLIDATSINEVDATAIATLFEIADELSSQGIALYFSHTKAIIMDVFDRSGFTEKLGRNHFFSNKESFIQYYKELYLTNKTP